MKFRATLIAAVIIVLLIAAAKLYGVSFERKETVFEPTEYETFAFIDNTAFVSGATE